MSRKKGGGTTKNGRDSAGQRLGVKVFAGQSVPAGSIIVRQRGTKFYPGQNAGMGRDYTIYTKVTGTVDFNIGFKGRKFIDITPLAMAAEAAGRNGGSSSGKSVAEPKAKATAKAAPKVKADAEAEAGAKAESKAKAAAKPKAAKPKVKAAAASK